MAWKKGGTLTHTHTLKINCKCFSTHAFNCKPKVHTGKQANTQSNITAVAHCALRLRIYYIMYIMLC